MNPITQRSTTSGQMNGLGTQTKGNAHKATANQEGSIEKLGNERLVYLLLNFMVSEQDETLTFLNYDNADGYRALTLP